MGSMIAMWRRELEEIGYRSDLMTDVEVREIYRHCQECGYV